MSIIGFLLLGLIAGAIARALMPGRESGGIIVNPLDTNAIANADFKVHPPWISWPNYK